MQDLAFVWKEDAKDTPIKFVKVGVAINSMTQSV